MGTHPNGPSKLESGQPLQEYIEKTPEALGSHEKGTLQFLFKVLSVNKALSVQSHPTKVVSQLSLSDTECDVVGKSQGTSCERPQELPRRQSQAGNGDRVDRLRVALRIPSAARDHFEL